MEPITSDNQLEDKIRSLILGNGTVIQNQNAQSKTIPSAPTRVNHASPAHSQHLSNNASQQQMPSNHLQYSTAGNKYKQYATGASHQQNAYKNERQRPPRQADPQPLHSQNPARLMHRGSAQTSASQDGNLSRTNYRSAPSKFTPLGRPQQSRFEQVNAQCQYLEQMAAQWLPDLEMSPGEFESKDTFRNHLEQACQRAVMSEYPLNPPNIGLQCFGSLSSGFGMPGSDMDLALIASYVTPELPRLLERILLDMGHGVRLLSRTRVPIIKVCEKPSEDLYAALREERQKWESLTPEEKIKYDQTGRPEEDVMEEAKGEGEQPDQQPGNLTRSGKAEKAAEPVTQPNETSQHSDAGHEGEHRRSNQQDQPDKPDHASDQENATNGQQSNHAVNPEDQTSQSTSGSTKDKTPKPHRARRPWYREKRPGPLDFPKNGVGIQCDINFSNPLGMHNTLLLRCYSHCDVRVRLMVLLVKSWASRRKINSGYNGTLSSYGYVLMVLHYLVNIVQPPVCPNLQLTRRNAGVPPVAADPNAVCEGWDVRFWRNEAEILRLAAKGMLSHNTEPLGMLLRGFFHYYAQQGYEAPHGGFAWTMHVLSLRTAGGLLSKEAKGWTGAKTTMQDKKEIRHRYLFAIEDPFELDHNVARTVTHNGIVAIRDEFRRAWRILVQVGRGQPLDERDRDLFAPVVDVQPDKPEGGLEEGTAAVVAGAELLPG